MNREGTGGTKVTPAGSKYIDAGPRGICNLKNWCSIDLQFTGQYKIVRTIKNRLVSTYQLVIHYRQILRCNRYIVHIYICCNVRILDVLSHIHEHVKESNIKRQFVSKLRIKAFDDSFENQSYLMVHLLTLATCGSIFYKNNLSSFSQYIYKLKIR